jgi:TM2 domain-containing membrane protein YozV
MTAAISPKSRLAAFLLCWFFGYFGAHRFYVGKIGTGILMILTLGGMGIWIIVDAIVIIIGSFRDKYGRRVFNWIEPRAPSS